MRLGIIKKNGIIATVIADASLPALHNNICINYAEVSKAEILDMQYICAFKVEISLETHVIQV